MIVSNVATHFDSEFQIILVTWSYTEVVDVYIAAANFKFYLHKLTSHVQLTAYIDCFTSSTSIGNIFYYAVGFRSRRCGVDNAAIERTRNG